MRTPLLAWVNLSRPDEADFDQIYQTARGAQELPWYHPEPPRMLQEVVSSRGRTGRALDVGCGDGMCSVHLARAGYQVTSLDFARGAVEMTGAAARAAGVQTELVHANVLTWSTQERFDLILDSSCLHVRAFRRSDLPRYKRQILSWLAEDGDYVLVHFDRLHPLDWRPMGPRRRSRAQILALFSPELQEQRTDYSERPAPLPVGPVVRERSYWFRRSRA